jgi:CubicO group peptidase (beta-lactamase class C family)
MTRVRPSIVGVLAVAAVATAGVGRTIEGQTPGQPARTSQATTEAAGLSASRLQDATALLNLYVKEQKIAGAVAAVGRHGRLAYLEAVGMQDLATRTPMTPRSLFRIYSMTKAVTAVAAMMLHEEGHFKLDDPVSRFLPEFKEVMVQGAEGAASHRPAREITVSDLLLHTSGLSHRTSDLYRTARVRARSDSLPAFVGKIVRAPLMEDPGTRYRYSEGTTVVGRLVEIWSGRPFDVFLAERVLGPLGMADTGFWVAPENKSRLATVYGPAPAGGLTPIEIEEVPFTERPALIEGAVGLVSTAPDFFRFAQMLLNGGELDGKRLLSARTVETITANGLPDAVLKARGGGMGWGLANVNVVMDPARAGYPANRGEYGWDGTAGTIFWSDPATGTIAILMTQSVPANPDSLRQKFKAIIQQSVVD